MTYSVKSYHNLSTKLYIMNQSVNVKTNFKKGELIVIIIYIDNCWV